MNKVGIQEVDVPLSSLFSSPSTKLDSTVRRRVYAEEMRLILTHTAMGSIVSTLFAIFVVAHLVQGTGDSGVPKLFVLIWLTLKIGIVIPRVLHAYHCKRLDDAGEVAPYHWTVPLLTVDGSVWGLGGAALMVGATGAFATTVAAVLACVACVATFGLQVRALAAMAYVVPMLGPVAVMLLARGDDIGLIGGIGLVFFLSLLARTSNSWERRMSEVFQLRIATERAANQAVAARAEAEYNANQLGAALGLADVHAKSKDRLIAVVSHELRTPLNGILGLVRLLRSKTQLDVDQVNNTLLLVQQSGEHLSRLVDDLLDTAAMESGRLALRLEPTKLVDLIAGIQSDFSVRADEMGLRFAVHMSPWVPTWVMGDAVRISQVVTNLLTNAMKFTPMGGTVSMRVDVEDETSRVLFVVEDTGPGVPVIDMERIFEPFVQVNATPGSRPAGVGLGLPICRHLARQMGGDVSCTKATSQGSAFLFSARLRELIPETVDTNIDMDKLARGPKLDQQSEEAPLGPPVALVVDDDHVSAIVASEVARTAGCEPHILGSGADLLRRYAYGPAPAIILIDYHMPGINGGEVAEAIRRYERLKSLSRVPIICLSGSASLLEAGDPIGDSVDLVLAKPCQPQQLSEAIRRFVGKRIPRQADDLKAEQPSVNGGSAS